MQLVPIYTRLQFSLALRILWYVETLFAGTAVVEVFHYQYNTRITENFRLNAVTHKNVWSLWMRGLHDKHNLNSRLPFHPIVL